MFSALALFLGGAMKIISQGPLLDDSYTEINGKKYSFLYVKSVRLAKIGNILFISGSVIGLLLLLIEK